MIDWKYVLKRVVASLVIFLCIYFLKSYLLLQVHASTLYPSDACVIGGNNTSVCNSPPVYDTFNTSYGVSGFNVWFQETGLLQSGETHYITFTAYIQGNNADTVLSDMSLFTGNNGSASSRAYPDRNENFNFYEVTSNSFRLVWSFELDSYSNFDTLRFSWATSNTVGFNGMIFGLQSAELSISTNSNGGSSGSDTGNSDIINNNNQNTQSIINNQNDNTEDIINNQNDNTQNIINNQNQNTQNMIDSQKVCKFYDNTSIALINSFLDSDGSIGSNTTYGITDFIPIQASSIIPTTVVASGVRYFCFYNINKALISCSALSTMVVDTPLSIPANSAYFRSSIQKNNNRPTFKVCTDGNQALDNALTDDSINANTGNEFFDNFNYGDDSFSGVITAPLRFFNKLTETCQPLDISVYGTTVSIPCGTTVFWDKPSVSSFRVWWNMFFGGILLYGLSLKAYKVIHDALDPQKDNIESVGV